MSRIILIAFFCSLLIPAASEGQDQKTAKALLKSVEPRIRSIYQKNEFSRKVFRGKWLPDSSGYIVKNRGKSGATKYHVTTGEVSEFNQSKPDLLSPDGASHIKHQGRNLVVISDGKTFPLTNHKPKDPFHNYSATWSPDSQRIAYISSDSSKVKLRSVLVPGDPSYPGVSQTRFARVGGTIPSLKVGLVDARGGETEWLPLPQSKDGFYLGQIEWAGNSQELLVEKFSRFRNEREYLIFNVDTGDVKRIYHETDPAWVVASIAKNNGIEWIDNGQSFLILSEKDGWRHAYAYSRDGELKHLLTPGDFDIIEKVKVDQGNGWLYFNASPENATQKYLYRVKLDGSGTAERVTPEKKSGYNDYQFSPDGRWAFHTWSNFDTPPVTKLVEFPGHKTVRTLEDNRQLKEKMNALPSQTTDFFSIELDEGISMDAWMIKPSHFDPEKKYPVLIYVYGEPHGQTVLDQWGAAQADYHRAVAELGYLIVSIDNRGTPAPKGAAWRRSVFGSLGPISTEEQAAGLKELAASRPYVDLSRVGIWGWSGGGSNTLNAMFRKPDTYQVGIAVVPKPQPHLYNAWFQEIYMRTREVNAEGYRKSAPINFADGLQGDLLIIHGSGETNTHLQIVEGLADRLIELGKPFDFMVYPNRDHGIREGKGTSYHMRMHMIRYLLTHLKPGAEN